MKNDSDAFPGKVYINGSLFNKDEISSVKVSINYFSLFIDILPSFGISCAIHLLLNRFGSSYWGDGNDELFSLPYSAVLSVLMMSAMLYLTLLSFSSKGREIWDVTIKVKDSIIHVRTTTRTKADSMKIEIIEQISST